MHCNGCIHEYKYKYICIYIYIHISRDSDRDALPVKYRQASGFPSRAYGCTAL